MAICKEQWHTRKLLLLLSRTSTTTLWSLRGGRARPTATCGYRLCSTAEVLGRVRLNACSVFGGAPRAHDNATDDQPQRLRRNEDNARSKERSMAAKRGKDLRLLRTINTQGSEQASMLPLLSVLIFEFEAKFVCRFLLSSCWLPSSLRVVVTSHHIRGSKYKPPVVARPRIRGESV